MAVEDMETLVRCFDAGQSSRNTKEAFDEFVRAGDWEVVEEDLPGAMFDLGQASACLPEDKRNQVRGAMFSLFRAVRDRDRDRAQRALRDLDVAIVPGA